MIRWCGKPAGTRQIIELLGLGKKHGYEAMWRPVQYLLTAGSSPPPPLESGELGELARYKRPLPGVQNYDQLPSREVTHALSAAL